MSSATWPRLQTRIITADRPLATLAAGAALCFVPLSIAVSETFLAIALIARLVEIARHPSVTRVPRLFWFWLAWAGLETAVWLHAPDRRTGAGEIRHLLLIAALFITLSALNGVHDMVRVWKGILITATLGSGALILEFCVRVVRYRHELASGGDPDLYLRTGGLLHHWMVYGTVEILVFAALLEFRTAYPEERRWTAIALWVQSLAMVLSLTRSLWFAAFCVLAIHKFCRRRGADIRVCRVETRLDAFRPPTESHENPSRATWRRDSSLPRRDSSRRVSGAHRILPFRGGFRGCRVETRLDAFRPPTESLLTNRFLAPALVVAAIALLMAAAPVRHRITETFQPDHYSYAERVEMWRVGWRMIRQHAVVGIGPGNVESRYAEFLTPGELLPAYHGHLHNNALQLSAEFGVPVFGAALLFVIVLFRELSAANRRAHNRESQFLCRTALYGLTGFLIIGMMDYTYGHSLGIILLAFTVTPAWTCASPRTP